MDHDRAGYLMVLLFSLSIIGALGLSERQTIKELLVLASDNSLMVLTEIEWDVLNQLWNACELDTMDIKSYGKILKFWDMNEDDLRQPMSADLQRIINKLPSQSESELMECLMRNHFPKKLSGKEDRYDNWYVKHLEYLFAWCTKGRRHLVDSLSLNGLAHPPVPASAPSSQVLASAPSPHRQPPVAAPALDHQGQVGTTSQLNSSPSTQLAPSSAQPARGTNTNGSPGSVPAPSDDHANDTRTIILAVVVTAASTFLFAGLLFYCYCKCCNSRVKSGDSQKDERPLLNLSMSDFSTGSSPMSVIMDNSMLGGLPTEIERGKLVAYSFSSSPSKSRWSMKVGLPPPPPSQVLQSMSPRASFPSVVESEESAISFPQVMTSSLTIPPFQSTRSNTQPPPAPPSPSSLHPPSPLPHPPPHPSPPPSSLPPPFSPPPPPTCPPPPPPPPPALAGPPPCPLSMSPSGPPPPPPLPIGGKPGLRPPPPPKNALPPPPPLIFSKVSRSSFLGPGSTGASVSGKVSDAMEGEPPKAKLKPFFWDKVLANPDHSMVWHQIKSGSFQFNEEMIEALFGYGSNGKQKNDPRKETVCDAPGLCQILDPKKSQNLSILLLALNVTTEEVCDALLEGNELSVELLQNLLKMEPTAEEESKLRTYNGELSQLGPAERFLKALVEIPFAFKRLDVLLFMGILGEEMAHVKKSFATLEVACKELRSSRLFMKLLEAVLKTGNRMNDGTFRGGAQAFKLDTLLKLSDVKGTDGKTTLLHFVVQEIIRSEGARAAQAARESGSVCSLNSEENFEEARSETADHYRSLGLQIVSGLGGELENVKKAAAIDADMLTNSVSTLANMLRRTKNFVDSEMKGVEESGQFLQTLTCFVEHAEGEISWLLNEEKRIMSLVKGTVDYFHDNSSKGEGLRLFVIVRDFLCMLDKACKEVRETPRRPPQMPRTREASTVPLPNPKHQLFPIATDRQEDSSDDDSASL